MSRLLQRLLARALGFCFPGVDEPESPEQPELELDTPEDPETPPEEPDLEGEPEDDPEPARERRTSRSEERAEEAARLAREAHEAVQRIQNQPRPDPRLEEEERILRDPNTDALRKWQIESDRVLRDSAQQSQRALAQAQDLADSATYQSKATAQPLYAKYSERVESKLREIRAMGQNMPREQILTVLIGQDMLKGNLKPKAGSGAKGTPVSRGKSPGARSDTPARSGASEREKRAARLANTPI